MLNGTLGDVGPHDDASYGGEVSDSVFSLDYYRTKAREFQVLMNQLDLSAAAAQTVLDAYGEQQEDGTSLISDDLACDLINRLEEFDNRKTLLRGTAEAINMAAAGINMVGGRFPQLSVPSGLGFLPAIAAPAALVAAIGTAAALVVWGAQWMQGLNDRLKTAVYLNAVEDPVKKAALVQALAASDAAIATSSGTGLSNIAGMVKWSALAVAAYLAYSVWSKTR